MSAKKVPLDVIKEYSKLHREIKSIVRFNSDFVEVVGETTNSISIDDVDKESSFYYNVSSPEFKNSKVNYTVDFSPRSRTSNSNLLGLAEYKDVIEFLHRWINFLKEYSLITYSEEQELENKYVKEQEEWFSMLDTEDSDTPLELNTQLALDNYLQKSIKYAKDENEGDLAEELESFKQKIGSLTKTQMIVNLNTILAKTRVKSFKLFKVFMKLLLQEGFSFVAQKSFTLLLEG